MPRRFLLRHNRAVGDVVVLTALARDIKLAYPECEIDVETSAMDLWRNNPHLTPLKGRRDKTGVEHITCTYGEGIRSQTRETLHFIAEFHRNFEKQTRLHVPLRLPHGDIHLSSEERSTSLISGRYWIAISGGKSDFTAKVWKTSRMQEVVNRIVGELGLGVVQIGSTDAGHWHPPLANVLNLTGESNLRDMLRLIQHAEGVICGVTGAMHMAAALQRPCVVLGGGREAWWWEAYVRENRGLGPSVLKLRVPHRFLHTIGLLDCCAAHGCWRSKVVKINEDDSLCKHPVHAVGQAVPLCMDLITTEMVFDAVRSYYADGTLPALSSGTVAPALSPAGEESTYARPATPAPTKRRRLLIEL